MVRCTPEKYQKMGITGFIRPCKDFSIFRYFSGVLLTILMESLLGMADDLYGTYSDLGILDVFDFWIDKSLEDHTGNNSRVFHCWSKNFTNSDIIDIESDCVWSYKKVTKVITKVTQMVTKCYLLEGKQRMLWQQVCSKSLHFHIVCSWMRLL